MLGAILLIESVKIPAIGIGMVVAVVCFGVFYVREKRKTPETE